MSDTPITDSLAFDLMETHEYQERTVGGREEKNTSGAYVHAEDARELEQKLNIANKTVQLLHVALLKKDEELGYQQQAHAKAIMNSRPLKKVQL